MRGGCIQAVAIFDPLTPALSRREREEVIQDSSDGR